ncbi:MAG: nuclear transport factor 2 family protein [Burkholderiales bacterium]|nr:nuclear transport factor 2 family protein [Burkholderiales bacterium]
MKNMAMELTTHRSPAEVLDDHLRESQHGSVEDDLVRNYAEELIVLTGGGVFRGHDGLRQLAQRLREELPDATFEYTARVVEGEVGFLEWSARGRGAEIKDGADSYLIRDGRIIAQTIHYTVIASKG